MASEHVIGGGGGIFFSFLYFGDVFNNPIIPLMLVGYEMISNACSWNTVIVKYHMCNYYSDPCI